MLSESILTKVHCSVCGLLLRNQKNLILTHQFGIEWEDSHSLDFYVLYLYFTFLGPLIF